MKQHKNIMFIEFSLIFIFYVLGDVITTGIGLRMGYVEMHTIPQFLLYYSNYNIVLLFITKLIVVILLYFASKYYIIHNKSVISHVLNIFAIAVGIVYTLSNLLLILSGYNLFQLIGLM